MKGIDDEEMKRKCESEEIEKGLEIEKEDGELKWGKVLREKEKNLKNGIIVVKEEVKKNGWVGWRKESEIEEEGWGIFDELRIS